MAFRSTRPRQEPPPPPRGESVLTIPDALLAWGRDAARAVTWARDWAQEVTELVARSEQAPLDERATEELLSRLEGLVVEAIRFERSDLLEGLDIQTMEWLGLAVTFDMSGESVSVGREGTFTWSEVRVLHQAWEQALLAKRLREEGSGGEGYPPPEPLGAMALRSLKLLRSEWPEARIGDVTPSEEHVCISCAKLLTTLAIELDGDLHYCGACWSENIGEPARRGQEAILTARRKAQAQASKRSRSN